MCWSYYGAKTNIVKLYPKPVHDKIIEPFAGSARYACQYWDRDVLLVDKYDVIVKIWQWLTQCSVNDILSLPRFKAGDNINSVHYDCEEARLLTGYLVGFGFVSPRDTATPRLRNRPNAQEFTIKKIAAWLPRFRHWKVQLGSYEDIPNQKATWYIDPPYQFGGHSYVKNNRHIDFKHLAEWSRDREGQTIVCENTRATWLPFKKIAQQGVYNFHRDQPSNGKYSEAMWTNMENLAYPGKQIQLL